MSINPTLIMELPTGEQWNDCDFPDDDWNVGEERNPLADKPRLFPSSNSNCYPGWPGECHEECYIFTNSVNDAWTCAVHQIMSCRNTEVIVFVGSIGANKKQKTNGDRAFKRFIKTLRDLSHGELFIGVKNSEHYAIDWY